LYVWNNGHTHSALFMYSLVGTAGLAAFTQYKLDIQMDQLLNSVDPLTEFDSKLNSRRLTRFVFTPLLGDFCALRMTCIAITLVNHSLYHGRLTPFASLAALEVLSFTKIIIYLKDFANYRKVFLWA